MSVDYISEKEVLEAIYTRVFEEKQQERKAKRDSVTAGGVGNLFLTNLTSGHRKEAVQNDINERLPKGDSEYIIKTYPKDEILNAVRAFYEDKAKDFNEVVEILELLKLGEPSKMNLCKMLKYLEAEIPSEDLSRVFSFDFFLTGEGLTDNDLRETAYREMRDNIQVLFMERDNEYIRSMAMFVTKFLESNSFLERVYIDTLIYISRHCDFTPEKVVRFRTLM
jgi:hypothetical protein